MQRGIEMSETTDPNAVRPGCQMYASAPQYGGALMVLARLWGIFPVMNPRFSLTGLMPQVVAIAAFGMIRLDVRARKQGA